MISQEWNSFDILEFPLVDLSIVEFFQQLKVDVDTDVFVVAVVFVTISFQLYHYLG